MRTRLALAAVLPLLVLVSLTACAPRHATIDDCVTYMSTVLEDFDRNEDLGSVLNMCAGMMEARSQEELDEIFLPE